MTRRLLLGALAALALAGCDSAPDGPGTIGAVVESPQPLGAVVLEFTGGGVEGFEGQGNTRVFSAVIDASDMTHRLILVSPDGSPMRFGINVVNVRDARPTVAAVSAASPENLPITPAGLQVRLER